MSEFGDAIKKLKDLNQQIAVGPVDDDKTQLLNEIESHIVKIAENIAQIHALGRKIKNEENRRLFGQELKLKSDDRRVREKDETLKDEFEQFQAEITRLKMTLGFQA